jgi:hypothetical protein
VIDKNIFRTQEADEVFVPNGLDLVPWRPVVHAVMLKVLAENLQLSEESSVSPTKQLATSVQADGLNARPSSDLSFEFESYQDQPMNFQPTRELANVMSLPTFISDPATPLVDR